MLKNLNWTTSYKKVSLKTGFFVFVGVGATHSGCYTWEKLPT
jgi:hypothetical protein